MRKRLFSSCDEDQASQTANKRTASTPTPIFNPFVCLIAEVLLPYDGSRDREAKPVLLSDDSVVFTDRGELRMRTGAADGASVLLSTQETLIGALSDDTLVLDRGGRGGYSALGVFRIDGDSRELQHLCSFERPSLRDTSWDACSVSDTAFIVSYSNGKLQRLSRDSPTGTWRRDSRLYRGSSFAQPLLSDLCDYGGDPPVGESLEWGHIWRRAGWEAQGWTHEVPDCDLDCDRHPPTHGSDVLLDVHWFASVLNARAGIRFRIRHAELDNQRDTLMMLPHDERLHIVRFEASPKPSLSFAEASPGTPGSSVRCPLLALSPRSCCGEGLFFHAHPYRRGVLCVLDVPQYEAADKYAFYELLPYALSTLRGRCVFTCAVYLRQRLLSKASVLRLPAHLADEVIRRGAGLVDESPSALSAADRRR